MSLSIKFFRMIHPSCMLSFIIGIIIIITGGILDNIQGPLMKEDCIIVDHHQSTITFCYNDHCNTTNVVPYNYLLISDCILDRIYPINSTINCYFYNKSGKNIPSLIKPYNISLPFYIMGTSASLVFLLLDLFMFLSINMRLLSSKQLFKLYFLNSNPNQ